MTGVSERWQLGHRPALDGLRGVAVLLVVVSHLSLNEAGTVRALGLVGVSAFFTLSGFLITALLLEEHARTGTVDLAEFFRRRARRLLPAMLVCVTVVTAAAAAVGGQNLVGPALGALTYTSNWLSIGGATEGSPLAHLWSLAVEEQFYLLWPAAFLLLARQGRRALRLALMAAIATSLLLSFALLTQGIERVYYGSDTRGYGLLAGCLLAVWVQGRPEHRGQLVAPAIATAAMVSVALLPFRATQILGPAIVTTLTVAVIYWVVGSRSVAWLEWKPLRLLGVRAYGLYLWHFPVAVAADHVFAGAGLLTMGFAVVPPTLLLAELSWRLVERPFLRSRAVGRSSGVVVVAGSSVQLR